MKYGMYGGKFIPLHKGHLYCIDTASKENDVVYVILFANGDDELRILKEYPNDKSLTLDSRFKCLSKVCKLYPNVKPIIIDVINCRLPNGKEDWDAETPLVRKYLPHIANVYSSEVSYGEYFSRAYPEATHRIVDAERKNYPISATMIRAMKTLEEKKNWTVGEENE